VHISGSAQVRLAYKDEIWVVSGDYKLEPDPNCIQFEPIKCTHFITESTFGLPVYDWKNPDVVYAEIRNWIEENQQNDVNSILLGYSLGKAQRLISAASPIGKVYTHTAIENTNMALRADRLPIPPTVQITKETDKKSLKGEIIVAPPAALNSTWLKTLKPYKVAIASGWMALRGARRRRNVDKGFVLSDHADWKGLNKAILATEAENVFVTHGYSDVFSQWLQEQGINAQVLNTMFEGELSEINETSEPVVA